MSGKNCLSLIVCLAFLIAAIQPALAESPYAATVAPFDASPVIDGTINAGEWDGALRTTGALGLNSHWLEPRMSGAWFGFTNERFYIAVISELPPNGKLRAENRYRDSEVIWDEGIEIWIDPNRNNRAGGEGDLRFYNFHFNSTGTILDVAYDPNRDTPDTGWNGDWELANNVDTEAGIWTAEASIPISEFGLTAEDLPGRSIGLLIARNWKAGGWAQVSWFPHSGAFLSWFEYPRIVLTKDAPTVAIESLGEQVFDGQLQLQTRIFNSGPERIAKVSVLISSTDMPQIVDERLVELPANGAAAYVHNVPAGRLHANSQHTLNFTVQSPDDSETYMNYMMKWRQAPENKWPGVRLDPDPQAALRLFHYPSKRFIRLQIDTRELELDHEQQRSAQVTIAGSDGNVIKTEEVSWQGAPATVEIAYPELAADTYTVTVKIAGYDEPIERTFQRRYFPWEGNRLGIIAKVLPPFEPMSVEGNQVNVVLRSYTVNGLGLWDSVRASGNVSAGGPQELLAGPMSLKVNDGRPLHGQGRFTAARDHEVVYEGRAEHTGVTVRSRTTTEYDGCMKVELELMPGTERQELQALWLDIPLKDEMMPLFHVCTTGLRWNPAGYTPTGDGAVWDSRDFPDGNWYGNFKPYIWLGAEERGIAWFADNDRGWVLDVDTQQPRDSAPCLALSREGGVLTLRVNLIQKPFTVTEPRKIVFGLMASPAKPMPKDWRRMTFENPRLPGARRIAWMGSQYWGSDSSFASKYPRHGDFSVLAKMHEARLTGSMGDYRNYMRIWVANNMRPDQTVYEKNKDQMLSLIEWSLRHSAGAGRDSMYNVYWEEFHTTFWGHPEMAVFGDEWTGGRTTGTSVLAPSYQDFAVWYGAQFLRNGIGLYFDNSFLKRAYCTVNTAAYRLPDGSIQPSSGVWAHREYFKRIWVLHQQLAIPETPAIMMIHMTNAHLLPMFVWNESNLDLEWFYGPEPQQSKYSHPLLRAESIGRQTGNVPLVLASVENTHSPEERTRAERTKFGTMMVHDIKARGFHPLFNHVTEFGYGLDDCEVFNYWDTGYPVRTSNDRQVKSILLKRNNELLLVVCTWNPQPETVEIRFDSEKLGMTPATAVKAETNAALPLAGNTATLDLSAYGVEVIRLR